MHEIVPESRELLESFGYAPAKLQAALHIFPRKMWMYRNSPNSQNIHDLVWHLTHDEVIEYVQCRWFVSDFGAARLGLGLSGFPERLGYFSQNIKDGLALFRTLRLATYRFLATLPKSRWERAIEVPTHGTLTLPQWLQSREATVSDHIQKMNVIYIAWRTARFDPDRAPADDTLTRAASDRKAQFSMSISGNDRSE